MTPQQILAKLIADIEAKAYPAAVADAFELAAVAVPFIQSLFPVVPTPTPSPTPAPAAFMAHATTGIDHTVEALKAQLTLPAINWATLLPMLMSIITALLPLLSTTPKAA